MTNFIKEYGNNITFAIVILGFIVTIIVQWILFQSGWLKYLKHLTESPCFSLNY